ncbi:MAG: DUF84 family protein [Patescibacteria group bacterium]
MKIGVGSKNQTKVNAVRTVLAGYPLFADAEVFPVAVQVEEFGHPKSILETVEGAIDRAKQAYEGNDYGFGIEGGLIEIPKTKTGYMEIGVCCIYDGAQTHIGLSPAFEWPSKVLDGILNKGLDGSQAVKAAGLTVEDKLGEGQGIIGVLTKGRTSRTEQNAIAIRMALIHLENPEHY